MKKCVAVLFLSIYLLGTTQLAQLCKVPLLFSHYLEHKKENKDLNFISFIKMHYFNGDPKDADYDKDMKLPFKTYNFNYSVSTFIAFEISTLKLEKKNIIEHKEIKFTTSNSWYSNSYLDAIWQPPRVA